jgi:hypothetical protein
MEHWLGLESEVFRRSVFLATRGQKPQIGLIAQIFLDCLWNVVG